MLKLHDVFALKGTETPVFKLFGQNAAFRDPNLFFLHPGFLSKYFSEGPVTISKECMYNHGEFREGEHTAVMVQMEQLSPEEQRRFDVAFQTEKVGPKPHRGEVAYTEVDFSVELKAEKSESWSCFDHIPIKYVIAAKFQLDDDIWWNYVPLRPSAHTEGVLTATVVSCSPDDFNSPHFKRWELFRIQSCFYLEGSVTTPVLRSFETLEDAMRSADADIRYGEYDVLRGLQTAELMQYLRGQGLIVEETGRAYGERTGNHWYDEQE